MLKLQSYNQKTNETRSAYYENLNPHRLLGTSPIKRLHYCKYLYLSDAKTNHKVVLSLRRCPQDRGKLTLFNYQQIY